MPGFGRRLHFAVMLACILLVFAEASALAESRLVGVFSRPQKQSLPVGVISTGDPYQVIRRQLDWTLVRQGDIQGWARCADLVEDPPPVASFEPHQPQTPALDPAMQSNEWRDKNPLQALFAFALGDRERIDKMSDPYYRDRVAAVSDEWGPLYYRRTRDYYVRGIYLWDLDEQKIRLGVFKRRLYYENLLGSLGSEEAINSLLCSAPGVLGNREIFGRGREYYLELSLHF